METPGVASARVPIQVGGEQWDGRHPEWRLPRSCFRYALGRYQGRQVADGIELAACVASATILGSAALFKFAGKQSFRLILLALFELIVSVGLLVPAARPVALVVTIGLGLSFTLYAVRVTTAPCRCFGERLHVQSRVGRLVRSLAVVLFGSVGFVGWVFARGTSGGGEWVMTAIVAGLLLGWTAIVLPSLFSTSSSGVPTRYGGTYV